MEAHILPAFTEATKAVVDVRYEPTGLLLKRIEAGARPAIFVGITGSLEASTSKDDFDLTTFLPVAKSGIGVAVPPNASSPDIGSVDQLISALLAARSVAYSRNGPSGVYFSRLLRELGIAEQVDSRSTIVDQGPTAYALLDGRSDLAIHQLSELMLVPEAKIIGPLPHAVQHDTEFSAALSHNALEDSLAASLFDFITDASAARAYHASGLQSPDPRAVAGVQTR
ncbi:molybdate ABC transporter substrate-binding protein [Arthrobacter sp. StoSoilA2]|uniref:substrate-binding domain-containing protein n=1 Tax=Arthrobacter sp. StoSoilA2 TaxID=2830990 RepID=UPI001E7E2B24|nr:substrate-binding domain-containing protein [Arthrobacter sp. StoSoilA2]BCW35884.1 molybdate ABC transporter substrate-binding protein [Arthrobacter sp. StoSoilA2]